MSEPTTEEIVEKLSVLRDILPDELLNPAHTANIRPTIRVAVARAAVVRAVSGEWEPTLTPMCAIGDAGFMGIE